MATTDIRLDSWKDISEYLGCDVSTAQRWERERGLPIRRMPGGPGQSVFAIRSELDRWVIQRDSISQEKEIPEVKRHYRSLPSKWILLAGVLVVALLAVTTYWELLRTKVESANEAKQTTKVVDLARGFRFEMSELPVASAFVAAIADLNNDRIPDILFASGPSSSLKVVLGEGGGKFSEEHVFPTLRNAWFVTMADLDADGNMDAILAYYSQPVVTIMWGNGRGEFQTSTEIQIPAYSRTVRVVDINEDGTPDLLVAEPNNGIQILWNRRQRKITPGASIPLTNGVDRMVVQDLDGDGHLDVAASLGSEARETRIAFLSGDGHGNFKMRRDMTVSSAPVHLSAIDLNGDGATQLAYLEVANNYRILCPTGVFDYKECGSGSVRSDALLSVADINNDKKTDLIIAERSVNGIALHLSKGVGSTFEEYHLPLTGTPMLVTVADLDGDGLQDLVICMPWERRQIIALQRRN